MQIGQPEDKTIVPLFSPYNFSLESSYALDNSLLQFIQSEDFVSMIRAVFAAKLFHPIVDIYQYTRTYEQGLATAEYLMNHLEKHANRITYGEWNEWMVHFLYLQLQMLDYSNQWEEYVACYTQVLQAFADGQLDEHYSYLLKTYRYEIILRKLQKKQQGRKLGNLLRHQQNRLSKEEIDSRFERVVCLLKCAYLSGSGSLWH